MHQNVRFISKVPCKVSLGMFRHERIVRLALPDGQTLSLFVDESQVEVPRELEPGEEVDGFVKVAIVEENDGYAIIDLPQQSFTRGPRVSVPRAFVRTAA